MLHPDSKNQIAVLIDPEKVAKDLSALSSFCALLDVQFIDFLFLGGSTVSALEMDLVIETIKANTQIPTLLFPGSQEQITEKADGLLLLNLISGTNPDYLISQHIKAADRLWSSKLQILSTSYVLIDGGIITSVQRISQTLPIPPKNTTFIRSVLRAGQLIGHQLCYLEAGSGAQNPVPSSLISMAKEIFNVVIVGGGIRSVSAIKERHLAGANLVVIGNHLETNPAFLAEIKAYKKNL